jgi:hypothetical protein
MADPGWVFTGDDDLTVESEAEHQAALAEWQNLERRWMDYLARLEAQGDYTNWNWSGPPLELYLRSHPAAAALRPTDPATGGTNPQAEATRAAITDAQACFREFARRHNEARAHPPESTQQNGGASIQLEPSGPASPPNHTGSLALRSSALLPVRKLAALLARRNAVPFELAGTVAAVGLGLAAWAALRARRKQTA